MSDNLAELFERIDPHLVDLLRSAIRQATLEAPQPLVRSGSVVSVSEVDYSAQVLLDVDTIAGGNNSVTVQCPQGVPFAGTRCVVLLMPPAGCFLLGAAPPMNIASASTYFGPVAREGSLMYSQATDLYYGSNGTNYRELGRLAAWTDWTPTVTQNGARTVSISYAKYQRRGTTIDIETTVTITNAGTAGNAIVVGGFPFAPVRSGQALGAARYLDTGLAYYIGLAEFNATNAEVLLMTADGGVIVNYCGITPNIATANGDVIKLIGSYEIAP